MHFSIIYNFIAILIRSLQDSKGETFYGNYRSLTPSARKKYVRHLQVQMPELFTEMPISCRELTENMITGDFMSRLEKLIPSSASSEHDFSGVILLQVLEKCLSSRLSQEILAFPHGEEVSGLNTNQQETQILLLPRCKCAWERKGRGTAYRNNLMQHLNYLFFLDLKALKEFHIKNIFLQPPVSLAPENTLCISLSPLCDWIKVTEELSESSEGVRYFRIKGLKNAETLTELICQILQKAQQENADIVIFPELLGTEDAVKSIQSRLIEGEIFNLENKIPFLILLPSICKDGKNQCTILSGHGKLYGRQQKHEGFFQPLEDGSLAKEMLSTDNTICLFHMDGIGRFAAMICKDFLTDSYRELFLSQLEVRLLLVPSFSTGEHDFSLVSDKCKTEDCCVAWVNTCSAKSFLSPDKQDNLDIISFVQKSGSHRDRNIVKFYQHNSCKNGCCKKMQPCLFCTELIYHTYTF